MQRQIPDVHSPKTRGQAMVEYALILALVALALAAIFVTTGAAVGNVFSNTVYNLVGQDPNAVVQLTKYGGPNAFWETVTWVAEHPYQVTLAATLVHNPSQTPTDGPSPTPSDTPVIGSPSPTATFTPSPTMVDTSFSLPFTETVNNVDTYKKWRLDNSVYLGGGAWLGEYYSNQTFTPNVSTGKPDYTYWNYQIDPAYTFNINFDWGTTNYPIQTASLNWPVNRAAGFSIRYTRQIYLQADTNLRFTAAAADSVRVILDGSAIISRTSGASLSTPITPVEQLVAAGPHTLIVEYAELDGQEAGVKLDISPVGGGPGAVNPDDTVDSSNAASLCQWGPLNSTNSASLQWMFDDDTTSTDGVGPNLTCNLELRGRINLATASNPVLSFWDVWDFTGSSATAKLQVAEYSPSSTSPLALDRSGLSWVDVPLHNSGEANYNWTRQVVNLKDLGFAGKQVTLRFVITNPGGTTGTRRWYIDDITVAQQNPPGTVSVKQFWDLNSSSQKDDFIYDARWDLTSNRTYGAGTAWDDSPGYSPEVFSQGQPRVHYVELKSLVTLASAPAADNEGDTGEAELSFWSAYNINTNTKIQVEWTADTRDHTTGTADNWTVLGSPLANSLGGPLNSGSTMTFYEFPLGPETGIPQTGTFRLRFAMYLDTTSDWVSNGGGWWIDNIYLERASPPAYAPYPFNDNAEDPSLINPSSPNRQWLTPGSWARVAGAGRNNTAAYTDSPGDNYQPNVDNPIQMSKYLDLNNDTAGHSPKYGATPIKPTLTFWHWRDLATGTTIYVDMFLTKPGESAGAWYPIWSYSADQSYSPIGAADQEAWERVQIDLTQAYEDATATTGPRVLWSAVTASAQDNDDDVRLAFRVKSTGSSVADGMYVDDISVSDYTEDEWHLWATDTSVSGFNGNGTTYSDNMENSAGIGNWYDRWYGGGEWGAVTRPGSVNNQATTDSPGSNYHSNELSIMEMKKIIDLRGVAGTDQPVAYAWMLRKLDDSDSFSWQISQRDTSTTQSYDKVMGWSAWTPVLSTGDVPYNDNESWHRVQINLTPYIGQEIKLRLVLNTTQVQGAVSDGIYLDDITFTFIKNQRLFELPFFDAAQSTYNWVTEGNWGLAPDRYKGTGGGTAPLGSNPWTATFVSCDAIDVTTLCNDTLTNFDAVETLAGDPTGTAAAHPTSILTGTITEPLVLSYNSTIRPFGATDPKWSTQWVAKMTRYVTVEAPATFDFTILANDGIHASIDGPLDPVTHVPVGTQINTTPPWNLANDWNKNDTLAQEDITKVLDAGTYLITVDWLQNTGSAFLSFSVTDSNFAFTDSPNTANGSGGYDVVKSASYSDTALLLDGALDLKLIKNPIMQYYTEYEIGSTNPSTATLARVEVSNDGGFTWTQSGLSTSFGASTMDDPTIMGGSQLTSWLFKKHNLTAYAGLDSGGNPRSGFGYLNLRFRLTTQAEPDAISVTGWHDGWYITEITINGT